MMNKEQRKEWDSWVSSAIININYGNPHDALVVEANRYILKLERELQNIKGSKKIAAILKVQGKQ